MCYRVQCSHCGRPTFSGCGAHVEQVLGDVPQDQRCKCRETRGKASASAGADAGSWLQKLFK